MEITKKVDTTSGCVANIRMNAGGQMEEGNARFEVSVWDPKGTIPVKAQSILDANPDLECVKNMVKTRENEFREKFESLEEGLKDLADAYAEFIMYDHILRAMSVDMPATTENRWMPDNDLYRRTGERISNNVFKAWVYSVHEEKSWKNREMVWKVSYAVSLNSPVDNGYYVNIIAQVDDKTFTNKDAADKYIAGRKAWMEKMFFNEQNPVVPRDFEHFFLSNGIRIPGYRYEEKEGEKK